MKKTACESDLNYQKPRILYLDMAYTLKMVRDRGLEQEFDNRDCDGYFDYVWGVHPIADIPENRKLHFDGFNVSISKFSDVQTIIEGKSTYFSVFKKLFALNFIVSQIYFVGYLIRLVKRERISIVLSTDPYFCGLIGVLIKLFTGRPLVIWVLGNYDDLYETTGKAAMPRLFRWRWVEKILEKFVFRNASLVAGGNQNNLEFALNNGAKLNKSTVFPVGKNIHRQHLLEPVQRDTDELFSNNPKTNFFIYVGRMIADKHPDDVVRAFSVINQNVSNCALIMAGDGVMRASLEQMSRELRVNDKVHFLGNIKQKRLANILAGCFAVLSPLTGRALIEAALAGLPIVAYDRDWQKDFVGKSGAGLIVSFKDWKKMGEEAIYLLRHTDDAKRFAEASRRKGLDACDLDKLYGHERREFEKLLSCN